MPRAVCLAQSGGLTFAQQTAQGGNQKIDPSCSRLPNQQVADGGVVVNQHIAERDDPRQVRDDGGGGRNPMMRSVDMFPTPLLSKHVLHRPEPEVCGRCLGAQNSAMLAREGRGELRGAVARGDGVGLVQLLIGKPPPDDALQLIGDGILVALRQEVQDAPGLAGECAAALRVRGWRGDDELADSLEARLGTAADRLLKPLAVDLEELAMALEGDPVYGGGRIDLLTGEVWPQSAIEYAREMADNDEDDEDDDPDRWLRFDSEGSRPGYRDMEWFISEIDDPEVADRLSIAISGRGAFRRFKDTLSRWPDLMERWYAFSEDRQRGRARAWLADEGYVATSRYV